LSSAQVLAGVLAFEARRVELVFWGCIGFDMGSDAAQGMSRFCHLVNPQKKTNCKRRTFRTRGLNPRALQQLANRLGKGGRKTVQAAR
jgi:hypothetical protein